MNNFNTQNTHTHTEWNETWIDFKIYTIIYARLSYEMKKKEIMVMISNRIEKEKAGVHDTQKTEFKISTLCAQFCSSSHSLSLFTLFFSAIFMLQFKFYCCWCIFPILSSLYLQFRSVSAEALFSRCCCFFVGLPLSANYTISYHTFHTEH